VAPFQILGMRQLCSMFGKQNGVILLFAWFKSESRTEGLRPLFGSRVKSIHIKIIIGVLL
jgi:hypothetical protein